MSDGYDEETRHDDEPCPKCGEYEVRSRCCDNFNCEDGYCDEHEDDPLNFAPGEEYTLCQECWGQSVLLWCSKCGFDISLYEYKKQCGAGRVTPPHFGGAKEDGDERATTCNRVRPTPRHGRLHEATP